MINFCQCPSRVICHKCLYDVDIKIKWNFSDKPAAPEGPLQVSDVTAETAKLSWKEPEDNGGAEITG